MMTLEDIRARMNAAMMIGDMHDYVRDVAYLLKLVEALQEEIAHLRDTPKPRYN